MAQTRDGSCFELFAHEEREGHKNAEKCLAFPQQNESAPIGIFGLPQMHHILMLFYCYSVFDPPPKITCVLLSIQLPQRKFILASLGRGFAVAGSCRARRFLPIPELRAFSVVVGKYRNTGHFKT